MGRSSHPVGGRPASLLSQAKAVTYHPSASAGKPASTEARWRTSELATRRQAQPAQFGINRAVRSSVPPVLEPNRNCCPLAKADRFALLVDGSNYYGALAQAIAQAKHTVAIVGGIWTAGPGWARRRRRCADAAAARLPPGGRRRQPGPQHLHPDLGFSDPLRERARSQAGAGAGIPSNIHASI